MPRVPEFCAHVASFAPTWRDDAAPGATVHSPKEVSVGWDDDEDWVGTPPEGRYSRDRADPGFWWRQRPVSFAAAGLVVIIVVIVILAVV